MASKCWDWTGATDGHYGYGIIWIQGRRAGRAHRVAWELANGPIPAGMLVLHRCDRATCVRSEPGEVGHLFLGTALDNTRDMISKGRSLWQVDPERARRILDEARAVATPARGEDNPRSLLTNDAVRSIRERRAQGVPLKVLALEFGVSIFLICRVAKGNRWQHVT